MTTASKMQEIVNEFERANDRALGIVIEVTAIERGGRRRHTTAFVVDETILDDGMAVSSMYLRECVRAVLEPIRQSGGVIAVETVETESDA